VPKFGFRSRIGLVTAEVRLGELAKVAGEQVDLATLKAANVIPKTAKRARIMLSGTIDRPVTVTGAAWGVTGVARAGILAAGGLIADV
jgi:large subunit ribosomal protein L15